MTAGAEPRPVGLTVFFPAYNDSGTIASLVISARKTAARLTSDFEIIIVNDGSADRTAEIADELARTYPEVRVVHHPKNRGYGGALRSGFANATKELVFYTDGDAQYDPEELQSALAADDRRRGPGQRIQDQPLRSVPPDCDRTRVSLHGEDAVRALGARRGLRFPPDPPPGVRSRVARAQQRRHLPGDDEENPGRRVPDRGSPGPSLPPRLREITVLQRPPPRSHRDRTSAGCGSSWCCFAAAAAASRRRRNRRSVPASADRRANPPETTSA